MKHLFLFFVITTLMVGCETKQDVLSDIDKLRAQRSELQTQVSGLTTTVESKNSEISTLNEKLKELHIYASGKTPKYILKIHLRQTHFSFSIKKQINDAMNAIDFELPVDKDFYNTVSVGTQIVDNFRSGSFILYGSIGNWNMSVTAKEIRE